MRSGAASFSAKRRKLVCREIELGQLGRRQPNEEVPLLPEQPLASPSRLELLGQEPIEVEVQRARWVEMRCGSEIGLVEVGAPEVGTREVRSEEIGLSEESTCEVRA